jgi:phytoene dehydrogenase-like protein
MSRKTAGFPIGGSLALARAIETRFMDLGGTAHYGARVTKVLNGCRIDPVHNELMESGTLVDPIIQVTFGVKLDFSGSPAAMVECLKLPVPIAIGDRRIEWFNAKNFAFDPSMAPPGKSVLTSMFLTDWPYWEKLKGDPVAYEAEKERITQACIPARETRYPGIRDRIEMTDVTTHLTYERYTGN